MGRARRNGRIDPVFSIECRRHGHRLSRGEMIPADGEILHGQDINQPKNDYQRKPGRSWRAGIRNGWLYSPVSGSIRWIAAMSHSPRLAASPPGLPTLSAVTVIPSACRRSINTSSQDVGSAPRLGRTAKRRWFRVPAAPLDLREVEHVVDDRHQRLQSSPPEKFAFCRALTAMTLAAAPAMPASVFARTRGRAA
jgi:hypothetical protein